MGRNLADVEGWNINVNFFYEEGLNICIVPTEKENPWTSFNIRTDGGWVNGNTFILKQPKTTHNEDTNKASFKENYIEQIFAKFKLLFKIHL